MRYAVIGCGAVGGYYGGRLAHAGREVHFLFRSDYEHVREHGFRVDSCRGDFHLRDIHAYENVEEMPQCDVVLVALKTTNNHLLPRLLAPLLRPDTLVVLMQNGIGVEEDVQKMFPGQPIAAGVAFICSTKVGPGMLSHTNHGRVSVANFSCGDKKKIEEVVRDFNESGVPAVVGDYQETRWRKNILNMATNGMTVLMDTSCDLLVKNPHTCEVVRDLMLEAIEAAHACGVESIPEAFADEMVETTKLADAFFSSMKYDYDNHLPMELDYMYARPMAMAEARGCSLPKLRMLLQLLRSME